MVHVYEGPRAAKFTEAESRMADARDQVLGGGMRTSCFVGTEVQFAQFEIGIMTIIGV